jgi:hypothetical protein
MGRGRPTVDGERSRGIAGGVAAGAALGATAGVGALAARGQSGEVNTGVAAPITYTVPPVVTVARISDPVARNQAINQSYHAFDTATTAYLGDPLVANWTTYGQHASREAGTQINNLKAGLIVLRDSLTILNGISQPANPVAAYRAAQALLPTLRRIVGLLGEEGLLKQSMQLALAKAGITQADITSAIEAVEQAATFQWTDLIPGAQVAEAAAVAYHALSLGARLAIAVPSIITAVERVYGNMVQGNREIYENIAPAYRTFLTAGLQDPQTGAVGGQAYAGDSGGYVAAAFGKYEEVRRLRNEIEALPAGDAQRATLTTQRRALAHEANLLIGYQEQLVILQPIFDTMQEELAAMSGTMVLHDPNGAHALIGNWGDFYTRMGIDSSQAPADPTTVRPDALPPLRGRGDRRSRGTIAEYFEGGLDSRRIHNAPPRISNH